MHTSGEKRLLLKVPEAANLLGLGRTKLYELIARGDIPVVRIDRSVRISVETLEKWVASQVGKQQEA